MHRPQSVLMVFAISLLAIPIARASADPSIFTEAIPNSPPITGGPAWCSIAVDSWNTPHLSFGDLQDGVWHVKGGINGWTAPEPIDAAGGIATGIALDAFGRPSIAYIALTGTNPDVYTLKFARPLGSLWVVESVETGVYPTTSTTSLGLDAQGNPHIAYTTRDGNSFAVRYAKRYGGSWAIETVDPSASAPSLALDSAGRPHLAYLDATGSRLVYAHRIAGNWETENVESVVLSCALSLDANDRPHIVFGATHQEILTYAAKTGGSWTFETIDPAPNPGGLRVAIVVASDGTPQVTATQVAATQVRYGTRDGSSWHLELVDASAHDAAIVVDAGGKPHLAYTHYAAGPVAAPFYARAAESVEVIAASADTTFYQSGVDVVHLTVRTRRYSGPTGPVTLSAELLPTIGPIYHAGDDAFLLAPGESHVSVLSWAVPDSAYPWEFDLKVSLEDGAAGLRSPLSDRFFKNIFRAAQLPRIVFWQYMNLVVNCQQLDPQAECLYQMASAIPLVGSAAGAVLYYQNMCKAQEFMRRGDRCRAGVAFVSGMLVPAKLAVDGLLGGAPSLISRWKQLQSAGSAAMKCWESDYAATAACGPAPRGLIEGDPVAFADSLTTWIAEAIDSTETDVADALAVAGDCYLRVEADGSWADADSLGLILAQILSFGDAGGLATVTSHVHDLQGSDDDNLESAATFRLSFRASQPVALSLLHADAAGRTVLRYAEFQVTDQTLLSLPVRSDQENFPLFVDIDGDGRIDEIHYPGGVVVGAAATEPPAAQARLHLPHPNPFNPSTTLSFTLAEGARATLSIYDPAGRLVAQLLDRVLPAGRHQFAWSGRAAGGQALGSGVYFLRLESGPTIQTQRMLIVR